MNRLLQLMAEIWLANRQVISSNVFTSFGLDSPFTISCSCVSELQSSNNNNCWQIHHVIAWYLT